ncbi:MAG: iron citrate ABC transporter substrate-binding protein, partial [Acidobacteria bacterium]|nr:iron citrate ABC transporter substrate-binding protein [Acidobacteriota bacterium]
MTKKSQLTLVAVLLAFAIIIAGCGKKEPEKQESSKTETKESA